MSQLVPRLPVIRSLPRIVRVPALALVAIAAALAAAGCGSAALTTDDQTGNRVFYDVPVPAGFTTVRVETGSHEAGGRIPVEVTSIVYTGPATDTVAVLDYFRSEMPRNGWKEIAVEKTRAVRLTATKHGTSCTVEVTPAGDGPASSIVIRRWEPETK